MKRRHRWGSPDRRFLSERCRVRVRFQEVDSLRVVWHGNYLTYFEDGRNAFGRRYDFGYEKILEAGFIAPLVHVELDYFYPARFDQQLEVETRLHLDLGARIHAERVGLTEVVINNHLHDSLLLALASCQASPAYRARDRIPATGAGLKRVAGYPIPYATAARPTGKI